MKSNSYTKSTVTPLHRNPLKTIFSYMPCTLPGTFGDVHKGILLDQDMKNPQKVAVKTLNGKLLLSMNSIQNE